MEPYKDCGLSCGLTVSGATWCWGLNPSQVQGPLMKSLVIVARYYVLGNYVNLCGLGVDDKAYCVVSNTFQPVGGGRSFRSFSGSLVHMCGVDFTGDAYCWGSNAYGGLGISSDFGDHPNPELVGGGLK